MAAASARCPPAGSQRTARIAPNCIQKERTACPAPDSAAAVVSAFTHKMLVHSCHLPPAAACEAPKQQNRAVFKRASSAPDTSSCSFPRVRVVTMHTRLAGNPADSGPTPRAALLTQ